MIDCHGFEEDDLFEVDHVRHEVLDLIHSARNGDRFYPIQFNNALRTREFDGPTTTQADAEAALLIYPWMGTHDKGGLVVLSTDKLIEHLCDLWGEDRIVRLLLLIEEVA